MKKKLIIEPGGGLGNRILALISAFNLAKDCGIDDITVLWRNNNECGCEFEDVLVSLPMECEIKTIHFGKESYKKLLSEFKLFSAARKFIHQLCYDTFRKLVKRIQLDTREEWNSASDWKRYKDTVMSSGNKKVYIEAYYSFYGQMSCDGIVFNKNIEDRLSAFKEKNGRYVAMHIRRTDNVMAIKNSPTELFYDIIKKLVNDNPEGKIYIATDDQEILKDLVGKYPDNVITEASSAADRRSTEGMQFALYEMLILAGAETIYASYGSTFTMIANLIGQNKMITVKREETNVG